MSNTLAFSIFRKAREHYIAHRFDRSQALMTQYHSLVDYEKIAHCDRRLKGTPLFSVIIVAYATGEALLDCMASVLAQEGPNFEIILVDNGENDALHSQLASKPILWVQSPHNLLPSEGRNIGAYFAHGEYLVFLDDDALMSSDYLQEALKGMLKNVIALRGRISPKTVPLAKTLPQHYDLGDRSIPAELNLEGNMVIRRDVFQDLNGFDPVMFGHEGKELTRRCQLNYPEQQILYHPQLVIYHDWVDGKRLTAKRIRQAIGMEYLQHLEEYILNPGVTVLVYGGANLKYVDAFLASLVQHNTHTPIEILLWAKDSHRALPICRPYVSQLFVRVLPVSAQQLNRIAQKASYNTILLISLPMQIMSDVMPTWLQGNIPTRENVVLCTKQQLIALADDITITQSLECIAHSLGFLIPPLTVPPPDHPAEPKQTAPLCSAPSTPCRVGHQSKPNPTGRIQQAEIQITQLESNLDNIYKKINELEQRYLSLPNSSTKKKSLKNKLEETVLTSCRLLSDLKDAQDSLQELRIRKVCG